MPVAASRTAPAEHSRRRPGRHHPAAVPGASCHQSAWSLPRKKGREARCRSRASSRAPILARHSSRSPNARKKEVRCVSCLGDCANQARSLSYLQSGGVQSHCSSINNPQQRRNDSPEALQSVQLLAEIAVCLGSAHARISTRSPLLVCGTVFSARATPKVAFTSHAAGRGKVLAGLAVRRRASLFQAGNVRAWPAVRNSHRRAHRHNQNENFPKKRYD